MEIKANLDYFVSILDLKNIIYWRKGQIGKILIGYIFSINLIHGCMLFAGAKSFGHFLQMYKSIRLYL